MEKIFLGEMTSKELKEFLEKDTTVILPVGATEVCGQHCPVGTDHLTAKEISWRLGKKTQTVVAPVIPVGDSLNLMGYPGTLTVRAETLAQYIRNISFSLVASGFQRIFFLNTHAHNVHPIDQVARDLKPKGILSAQVDFWRLLFRLADESGLVESKNLAFGHGGEVNTSVAMAFFPNLVDIKRAQKVLPEPSLTSRYQGKIITYRDWADFSKTGSAGYPTLASEEKGKVFIEKTLELLAQFTKEFKSEPLPLRSDPLTKRREK
jgi:creatinine amidohydrolase/Fe(II)-dependent formamide hydrolase-like protein